MRGTKGVVNMENIRYIYIYEKLPRIIKYFHNFPIIIPPID